ncbi:MAG: sugar transferase, partial [Collinsella sp.]
FFDVVSCGCALILLAIPMAVIAVKIKSESEGPVIYAQRRVGKDGRVFNIYKFRSMYTDAESRGAQWAQDEDPRVTPFGKIMRKTRLDEIPQFWNVFKGDMSLIGPRPERPRFAKSSRSVFMAGITAPWCARAFWPCPGYRRLRSASQ